MNIIEVEQKILKLRKQLDEWGHEYYVLDKPTVDDSEYDKKMQELIALEGKYPELVSSDSPTQRVGGTIVDKFEKYYHQERMLSLANAFDDNDLNQFDRQIKKIIGKENFTYFVEPKIDGLSISLIYKNGNLVVGATRGDGAVGENVTENVRTIKSIPIKIENNADYFEVRGEVFLAKEQFKSINDKKLLNNEELFANPRNAAAGTIRQLDTKVAAERNLDAWIYYNMNRSTNKTHEDSLEELKKLKFKVNPLGKAFENIDDVYTYILELSKKRNDIPYEIDGIVVKVNEFNLYDEIGYNAKTPKWAIAYKFPAEVVTTKLLGIFPTVGRTGRITYNAELESVIIAGTTVRAATLHNADFVIQKDIRVGSIVKVKKAGDIIPEVIAPVIEENYQNLEKFKEAKNCPVCKSVLERTEGEVDQYCINSSCPRKLVRSIEHYVARDAANIDGVSIKLIEKFYENKIISSIADIYDLKNKKDEIIVLEKMGEKLFSNIISAIENSKNESMAKIMFGLGIRHVGKKTAQIICENFNDIEDLKNLKMEDLVKIHYIGETVATSIIDWFENKDNVNLITTLKNKGVKFVNKKMEKQVISSFDNKIFVITGTLSKPRNYFKNLIEKSGGKTTESVSKNTDYVLAGEAAGSKFEKAEALGVKIITEDDFKKMMEE